MLAEVTRDVGQSCEGIVFVINERSVEPTQLAGRTSKTLISAANGSGIITHNTAVFAEGHAPGHVHRVEDEVFFVNAGEGEVWIEGVPYGLRAGTAVHTASELVHNIHAAAPLHLLGFMVPHTVPGSYADVPPLSRDLDKPPENRASFVVYADERSVPGEPRSELLATERVTVALVLASPGSDVTYGAYGRDLIVHVLEGGGEVRVVAPLTEGADGGDAGTVDAGSAILLTGDEVAVLSAREDMRLLEVRATEWAPARG